jgi:hypothetical protein
MILSEQRRHEAAKNMNRRADIPVRSNVRRKTSAGVGDEIHSDLDVAADRNVRAPDSFPLNNPPPEHK